MLRNPSHLRPRALFPARRVSCWRDHICIDETSLSARLMFAVIVAGVSATLSGGPARSIAAGAQTPGPCDPPIGNPIMCENQWPGSPASGVGRHGQRR